MSVTPGLIDSHVHFDDPRLDSDREAVYQRARTAGIDAMIVPSVSAATWQRTTDICAHFPGCYPAYGLHPYFISEHQDRDLAALEQQLLSNPGIGVGECGLDFSHPDSDRERQKAFFIAQLQLAKRFQLPIIIHAHKAVEAVLDGIRASGHDRGMIHSYNGSMEQARRLIDMGFSLGFGGAITSPKASRLHQLVRKLPPEALLLETDAPDQAPWNWPGEHNEPAALTRVLDAMARLRPESGEELLAVTSGNARRLFGLPDTIHTVT